MIKLRRLNGIEITLNADIIEFIEATPDTIITLINGHKIVVLESVDEVIDKVIVYKRKVLNNYSVKEGQAGKEVQRWT